MAGPLQKFNIDRGSEEKNYMLGMVETGSEKMSDKYVCLLIKINIQLAIVASFSECVGTVSSLGLPGGKCTKGYVGVKMA